jgi:hypothetical protein
VRHSRSFCSSSLDTGTKDRHFRGQKWESEPRTEEDGITCRSEKPAECSHHSAVLVLIAEIGGNDAENERASVRRYLEMTCKHHVAPLAV